MRQLSTSANFENHVRKELLERCQQLKLNTLVFGLDDCKLELLASVKLYSRTTLVLDALDECDPRNRWKILKIIGDLLESTCAVRVFISSRPDRDIRDEYHSIPNIEIQATDNAHDIQKFIREEIEGHGNWRYMGQDLQNDIVTALFDKSQGM